VQEVVLTVPAGIGNAKTPLTVEYSGPGRRIHVTGTASDGDYEIREGKVLLELLPQQAATIEVTAR
jgi:hypothetical protein